MDSQHFDAAQEYSMRYEWLMFNDKKKIDEVSNLLFYYLLKLH